MPKTPLPFGTWPSALTAQAVAGDNLRFGRIEVWEGAVYWSEGRPAEGGRVAIMRLAPGGEPGDLLPAPFSARSRVHEYGGGEFHATPAGLFFVNDKDQQVYVIKQGSPPRQVTDAPGWRFADFSYDAKRDRLVCVAEIHAASTAHPRNLLAAIDLNKPAAQAPSVLLDGADFYASPRVGCEGQRLAWLEWNLPEMPWDAATLCTARFDRNSGAVLRKRRKAFPAFQPEWMDYAMLTYVLEWPRATLVLEAAGRSVPFNSAISDISRPLWSFNLKSYGFFKRQDGSRAVVGAGIINGETRLMATLEQRSPPILVDTALKSIEHLTPDGESIVCVGASDLHASAIVRQPLRGGAHQMLRAGASFDVDPADISAGEPVRLTDLEREPVYGFHYPPKNARFEGMPGARPPVIINCHGGPTGAFSPGFKPRTQFFTQRGFAVFDLNYSGSAGYGCDYRERLHGEWGVRDAADAEAAARHLIATGQAARGKVFIYGSSAGGYTALMALAKSDVFAGGVSAYGISDLEALQRTTHKFESGYIYGLIGAGEANAGELMRERSPITYAANIKTPVLLLQGLEDKVVPPEQSLLIAESLRARGVACEYIAFEGEGHGFRRAETIIAALEAELAFYRRTLGLAQN